MTTSAFLFEVLVDNITRIAIVYLRNIAMIYNIIKKKILHAFVTYRVDYFKATMPGIYSKCIQNIQIICM